MLLRVKGEDGLEPQHGIEDQEARDVEDQHGDRVGEPVLLVVLVDAGQGIQRLARGGEGPARGPCGSPVKTRVMYPPRGFTSASTSSVKTRIWIQPLRVMTGLPQNRSGRSRA